MTTLDVDGRLFTFVDSIEATKYDEWVFYLRRFQDLGVKAVDVVALSEDGVLYLVEVKDYTHPQAERMPHDLVERVAGKCRDTLAGLAAAQFNADGDEQRMARAALRSDRLRVVLHVELPQRTNRLFPGKDKQRADLQDQLRIKTRKALDPRATVQDHSTSNGLWTSRRGTAARASPSR